MTGTGVLLGQERPRPCGSRGCVRLHECRTDPRGTDHSVCKTPAQKTTGSGKMKPHSWCNRLTLASWGAAGKAVVHLGAPLYSSGQGVRSGRGKRGLATRGRLGRVAVACACLLSCYGTLDVFNKAPSWLEQAVCAHVALTPSLSSPTRHGSQPLPLPHDLVRLSQGPSTQTPVGVSCQPQPLDSSAPPASHLRHPLVRASCQLTGSHSRPPAPSVPV